jgi:hypothetical protein
MRAEGNAMRRTLIVYVLVAACAHGGGQGDNGDDQPKIDAPPSTHQDANPVVTPDAATPNPDASVPPADAVTPPTDARSGLFCMTNSQCTTSGECCVTLGGPSGFCAPGTIVLGNCVPQ